MPFRYQWLMCVISLLLWPLHAITAADDASPAVKVMSFNIRYGTAPDGENHWNRRKEFLIDTIRAYSPDLLGTQETLGFQRDYLASEFPEYDHLGVGRVDGGTDGEMTALFFRKERFERLDGGHFWLSETPEKIGSLSWDSSLPRMVTWVKLRERRGEAPLELVFFNTHFDHKGVVARVESARLLREKVDEIGNGTPVVVTGDFNAAEGSDPYKTLFARAADGPPPLVDSLRALEPSRGKHEGTFSGFKAEVTLGHRIDWIGLSPDWKILSAGIDRTAKDGVTPSDHFPVVATIALSEAEKE
ncbi:MAG: endonuclease/exonuclease/phosphatase family protein [Planctomycetaceae bacterium]